ncbi:MFS transporter [Nocardioides sp.]|uniref:MFS transporter n=1 Tax=Nocardioides sp. TaxID=35761 RepID=UPI0027242A7D|nr:MFS transporter [Nocardioides sp.]MDO9456715.1 MFS transporter [Nocardioides sp.]
MSLNIKPTHDVLARPLLPVALGTTLVLVAYVAPIVALPATAVDLGAGPAGRAWILSSMSVGLAAALLVSGVLGDRFGRRVLYDVGLGLVALGGVVCAAAPGTAVLVTGRVVQGVGGAAVLACGLALLAARFPPGPERLRATSMWGASVGLGIATGSLVTAAVGELGTGWREVYVVHVVAAVGLVALSSRLGTSRAEHPRRVDVPGLVLLVGGLTLLVAALTQARDGVDGLTVVLGVAALACLGGLALVEPRVGEPLLDPALLRRPGFVAATLGSLLLGISMIGLASLTPTIAQVGLGNGPWTGALLAAVWAGVSVVTSLALRRLPWTFAGPRGVAVLLGLVGLAQLTGLGLGTGSGVWRLAVVMAATGVGTGLLNAVLGREAVANVPPDRTAMGSGANNTARYVGAAIGITLTVTIATHVGDSVVDGWNVVVVVCAAVLLVGAAVVALVGRTPQDVTSSPRG